MPPLGPPAPGAQTHMCAWIPPEIKLQTPPLPPPPRESKHTPLLPHRLFPRIRRIPGRALGARTWMRDLRSCPSPLPDQRCCPADSPRDLGDSFDGREQSETKRYSSVPAMGSETIETLRFSLAAAHNHTKVSQTRKQCRPYGKVCSSWE